MKPGRPLPASVEELSGLREGFERWLYARGAEVLVSGANYEVMRFRTARGSSVVYRKATGALTWTGESATAWQAYAGSRGGWRAYPAGCRTDRACPTVRTLAKRDGWTCFYCDAHLSPDNASVEHILSVAHGGPNHLANLTLSCRTCNSLAGHLSVAEKIRFRDKKRKA